MKIQPMAAPTSNQSSAPTDSRARAVAAFATASQQAPTPQEHPVANPNQVSPEEMSAIKSPSAPQSEEIPNKNEGVEEAPAKAEDTALSRQFAQLARQEKALRAKVQQQEQAIKAREQAIADREAAIEARNSQFSSDKYISIEEFKADPLSVMERTGESYDSLTQRLLNQQPKDPRVEATIGRLEAKIKALEEANSSAQKSYSEQQQQAYQSAVKQIELDARNLVKNDANFETIRATNSVKDVVELITQTYDKDGVLLTVEEAAQQVEDYLMEEAMKITRIQKIQKRLQSNASANTAKETQTQTPQKQQQMKTLTNATSSQRQLSAKERALLAFKGQLKA